MNKRVWNTAQKLAILREAEANGITATIRKYGVYKTSFYQWKQKFAIGGLDALKSQHYQINPELKRLQKENERLKTLLAEKELALSIKDALLKKSQSKRESGS